MEVFEHTGVSKPPFSGIMKSVSYLQVGLEMKLFSYLRKVVVNQDDVSKAAARVGKCHHCKPHGSNRTLRMGLGHVHV